MNAYVEFDYYQQTYGGTDITDRAVFNRMAIQSSYFLNEITFGRITEVTDEIKNATCAIADISYQEDRENKGVLIASESVGPHSVSYVKKSKTTQEYTKEKINIARMYLANTGLLYRGLASCNL